MTVRPRTLTGRARTVVAAGLRVVPVGRLLAPLAAVTPTGWAVAVVGATGLSRPTASKMRKAIAEEHGKAYVPRLFLSFSDLGLSDPEPSSAGSGGLPLTASGKPDRRAIRELVRRALDRRSPSS